MSATSIATRYAAALLGEALEQGLEASVEQDFALIERTADASPDLRMLFRSPIIEWHRKKKIVVEIFDGNISPLTMKFMMLVLDKGREKYFREMSREFARMLDAHRNILRVQVDSAKAMDESSKTALSALLAKKSGQTVMADYDEIPELIGGIRVTIGDKVFDGSLKRQLEDLKERIATASDN